MSRRTNVINNILSMGLTIAAVFLVAQICNARYTGVNFFAVIGLLASGAAITGFLCTFSHEAGHLIAGKKNGFAFVSVSVWFFRWRKVGKKTVFDFVLPGDAAGYTEMTPKSTENLEKRFKKMTAGALLLTGDGSESVTADRSGLAVPGDALLVAGELLARASPELRALFGT